MKHTLGDSALQDTSNIEPQAESSHSWDGREAKMLQTYIEQGSLFLKNYEASKIFALLHFFKLILLIFEG